MDKKKTICFCIIFILVALAVIGLVFVKGEKISNSVACIYSDGKLIEAIELKADDDYTFDVVSENGGVNTICVKGGEIGVLSADCPDKICVNTPHISDGVQPIVCLPNRLVIQIEAKKPDSYYENS